MKIVHTVFPVLFAGLLLPLLFCCKKEAPKTVPTAIISAVTNITASMANSGGNITFDGGSTVTARGVCWSTNQSPTTSDSKTADGAGTGSFTSAITGLTPGATYNIKAYATNSVGTGYSSQTTFTTLASAPVLTTADISAITATTATSGGNITNDGGSSVTARGVCWSTNQSPTTSDTKTTDGTGTGSFTSAITGLTPGTTYYSRAYATNSIGTAYGNQVTVTTTATLSTLTTAVVSVITSTTATSGGNITTDGGSPVTVRGVCWSTSSNPTIANSKTTDGTGVGSFTSSLSGLETNTTYYLRAYATNSVGTGYGNETLLKTSITIIDTDGNVYNTVIIGNQVWMIENLKTTKYRDGTSIQNVSDNTTWVKWNIRSAYCWYNNDSTSNKNKYGALYNSDAVNDSRNIAPTGWHIPTDAEWTALTTFLGGVDIAGGKLKEVGTGHWASPNTGATNSSGFTALPGGERSGFDGTFGAMGQSGNWWSSTQNNGIDANGYPYYYNFFHSISSGSASTGYGWAFSNGFSVRCIKD